MRLQPGKPPGLVHGEQQDWPSWHARLAPSSQRFAVYRYAVEGVSVMASPDICFAWLFKNREGFVSPSEPE
ncbi:hypothetical protein ColTof4_00602 [Colletotrichum tofieldiae]|nr:hypothetical protein ColTof3_07810 [Colletotrichum tofieldiae]GKT68179.1 hypothetical protein ColTof4_00602 [Colletotrichum tofieldiae]